MSENTDPENSLRSAGFVASTLPAEQKRPTKVHWGLGTFRGPNSLSCSCSHAWVEAVFCKGPLSGYVCGVPLWAFRRNNNGGCVSASFHCGKRKPKTVWGVDASIVDFNPSPNRSNQRPHRPTQTHSSHYCSLPQEGDPHLCLHPQRQRCCGVIEYVPWQPLINALARPPIACVSPFPVHGQTFASSSTECRRQIEGVNQER